MTTPTAPAPEEALFALQVGQEVVYANTVTDLVAALIPGYSDDHDLALEQRWRFAVLRADARQAELAVAAVERDHHLLDRLDEEATTALFTTRAEVLDVPAAWDCPIPLVLIATDFEPYTDQPRPDGNVLWVDPADERSLLISLTAAGDLAFYTREEPS